jgi:hypothetical protein
MLSLLSALGRALAGAARWVWTHRRWTLPVLLPALALVALLGWGWWSEHARRVGAEQDLRAEVQRQAREAELTRMGYLVATAARQADADRATLGLAAVRAQRDELEAKVGPFRTRLAAARRGKPGPAGGPPRPDQPGDEARPVLLRAGDELALGADLEVVEEKSGAGVVLGTLFVNRAADGARLSTQTFRRDTSWVTVPREACPAAPEPRELRIGAVGGGYAGKAGASWLVGGQVLYRDRWTLAGAGGPGAGVALVGVLF